MVTWGLGGGLAKVEIFCFRKIRHMGKVLLATAKPSSLNTPRGVTGPPGHLLAYLFLQRPSGILDTTNVHGMERAFVWYRLCICKSGIGGGM
jgi:hypothetical protein